jgi:hypothetical protein
VFVRLRWAVLGRKLGTISHKSLNDYSPELVNDGKRAKQSIDLVGAVIICFHN